MELMARKGGHWINLQIKAWSHSTHLQDSWHYRQTTHLKLLVYKKACSAWKRTNSVCNWIHLNHEASVDQKVRSFQSFNFEFFARFNQRLHSFPSSTLECQKNLPLKRIRAEKQKGFNLGRRHHQVSAQALFLFIRRMEKKCWRAIRRILNLSEDFFCSTSLPPGSTRWSVQHY